MYPEDATWLASMRTPLPFSRLIPHLSKAEGISFHSAEFQDSGCSRRSDSMFTPSPRSDERVANPLGKWKPLPSSRSLHTLCLIWLGLCRSCLPRIRVSFSLQQVQDLVSQVVSMSLGLISTWRRKNPWVFRAGRSLREARVAVPLVETLVRSAASARPETKSSVVASPGSLQGRPLEIGWLQYLQWFRIDDAPAARIKTATGFKTAKFERCMKKSVIATSFVHRKLTRPILGREFCCLTIRPMRNTPALLNMSNTETSMECCTCLRYYVHEHVSTLSCYNL